MGILGNGKITRKKERVAIYIPMDKNMMENGHGTKNQEMVLISTRMVTFSLEDGKMIEDQVREK